MPYTCQTYVLPDFDDPNHKGGAIRIHRRDAQEWNQKGYGIFHTVNEFWVTRRKQNLLFVNAWAIDMDEGDKKSMLGLIKKGLIPTLVIETKRGYHAYWAAKDGTPENYKLIVANRLVPYYNADKRAKDICRILRAPGYYHMKDPQNPFLIKTVHSTHVKYSEKEMFKFYPDVETPKKQKKLQRLAEKENPGEGDFWESVWNLNCEYALTLLSGSEYVGGETYLFTENSSGTKNIWVNGQSSSCWIDSSGRIGSSDGGGPTIYQWLNWFHKNPRKTIDIIKQEFPTCRTKQMSLI